MCGEGAIFVGWGSTSEPVECMLVQVRLQAKVVLEGKTRTSALLRALRYVEFCIVVFVDGCTAAACRSAFLEDFDRRRYLSLQRNK